MSRLSQEASRALFSPLSTVSALEACIQKNCHLWLDEDSTLNLLRRCVYDTETRDKTGHFSTVLMDEHGKPYMLMFRVHPDGSVQLCDREDE